MGELKSNTEHALISLLGDTPRVPRAFKSCLVVAKDRIATAGERMAIDRREKRGDFVWRLRS